MVLMAPEQVDALGVGNAEVTVRARNGQLRQGETKVQRGEYAAAPSPTMA